MDKTNKEKQKYSTEEREGARLSASQVLLSFAKQIPFPQLL
jgi:hypothetical protein